MHIFSYLDFCRHSNVTQSLKYCFEANFTPNLMIYNIAQMKVNVQVKGLLGFLFCLHLAKYQKKMRPEKKVANNTEINLAKQNQVTTIKITPERCGKWSIKNLKKFSS